MILAPLFLAILIYATTLWSPSSSVQDVYIYKSQVRQQGKLKHLARELVLDAEVKIKAVQYYRDQYYKALQYQLGDIVYEMRDFFKRMVKLYSFAERNMSYFPKDSNIHNQNIKTYLEIRRMAVEIENKVNMIQEWQFRRAPAEEHHQAMREPLRSGAGRAYDESQEQLREGVARGRIARAWRDGAARGPIARVWRDGVARERIARARRERQPPPRRAPLATGGGAKRKNNKWQYVRGYEFV